MEQLYVIKIGGNVIDDSRLLGNFLRDFSSVPGKKMLVHGGGKIATQIGDNLKIQSKYVDGRRITDDQTIDLVTMVYGGLVNKKVVAGLQSLACNAFGVTGADAMLIPAVKRPVKEIDYGWVGDIEPAAIPVDRWMNMMAWGVTPVVAPLTCDKEGHILNTNADTIAATLAAALSQRFNVSLYFCFEKKGVLEEVGNEDSFIKEIDDELFHKLKSENKLSAGILPKLKNAFDARKKGVNDVCIGSSENLPSLIRHSEGTRII